MKQQSPLHSSSFEYSFFESLDTYIHPTAIVGPQVTLGVGVKIGPYAVISGYTNIGDHTQIHAHAIIGSSAQDVSVRTLLGRVEIGSNVVIKEFCTVSASKAADGITHIGDRCFLMHFAHVCHDATLEHDVTLTNNVQLAGHSYIEHHAVLMAHVGVHQYCRVGAYSALAPHSGIRQDIPPFGLFTDRPAAFARLNLISLQRNGIATSAQPLKTVFGWFYRDKLPLADIITQCNAQPWHANKQVQQFLTFVTQSTRGVSRQRLGDK